MRDSGLTSISPNFAKSTSGRLGNAGPAAVIADLPGHHGLDEGLDVVLENARLAAGPGHLGKIDAEFAGKLAHGRACVRLAECLPR